MVQSVFEKLRAEVDRASDDYSKAKQEFWHTSAEVPSGLPFPDGTHRIENAARKQTVAMIAYTKALRRFNEFLLNGTVPEDLEKSEQPKESGSGRV